jgi:formylglycine-generating enzyme required for sulfatase activity
MKNKVTVEQFASFAKDPDVEDIGQASAWSKTAIGLADSIGPEKFPSLSPEEQAKIPPFYFRKQVPAFKVACEEAYSFGKWLGKPYFAARLPTPKQWDKAAGLWDHGEVVGPFLGSENPEPDDIAINREFDGPMEVGTAKMDQSPYGCRDMAGNGKEWTREVVRHGSTQYVPIDVPSESDTVWLRGQNYLGNKSLPDKPITYASLRDPDHPDKPVNHKYQEVAMYIGFRLVIELSDLSKP